MTTRLLLAAVAATASFAVACGADEKPTSSGASGPKASERQALLDFARCMRENGVDMPDPKFEGGRVTMRAGGPGDTISREKMQAAQKACAKYQKAIKPPDLSDAEQAENKKAALANAKCMRENGVPDFPDPVFDENGGAQIRITKELDPEGPAFKKAMQACEKTMPGAVAGATSKGGSE